MPQLRAEIHTSLIILGEGLPARWWESMTHPRKVAAFFGRQPSKADEQLGE
jgi:hypothetical protein